MTSTPSQDPKNDRQPIDALLDRGLTSRLTLVLGSDDSRRTKAIRDWLDRRDHTVVVVDGFLEGDGDSCPRKLIEAISGIGIVTENYAGSAVESDRQSQLISLINSLAALSQDIIIIIHDYQPCELADHTLTFILEHLPDHVHLYLTCDDAPGLPCIPRLRVRRQLQTVDARCCTAG